jgi:hypothetical protein
MPPLAVLPSGASFPAMQGKRDSSVANWIADGLLIGLDKHKGRDWLENSAGSNSQQPQVNAALDGAIICDGRLIHKVSATA